MPDWFSLDTLTNLTHDYRALGPIFGILLPFLEAFLPFLPLVVFIVANVAAYGLLFGFLISWVGSFVGAYTVFLVIRKYGRARVLGFITRHERIQKLILWVERNGFGPLFLLICFPFTPSALVNIVAGLSNIKKHTYLWTVASGKLIMIFVVSFIGSDLKALVTQPIRTAIVVIVIAILWFIGKRVEKRIEKKVEDDFRGIKAKRKRKRGETFE
ncbi:MULTISPECIES: TVP38/TMEM64 family protein [Psychrobacillus]|uniref:TVP38/TMEM64 family membrane protein n=1 Tax=Psychrobacillus faecigallinarum TaxID=2762235 RepID=A0ABR8R5P8_9BACI|nr:MULTISPECIES: TVP38/TMEM64 family protein [Psychrobacillus]MBD7942987.1 TVP38/TMEM64 family protein [Psychrobacillus faecigallinarum]QEY20448.1 TVP38/TMEM64 family protein [Psychrobacillus sp. AK 1817]QGM30983.1 TVP38/TMEM64 family protein [Bacillus sp. N3536]